MMPTTCLVRYAWYGRPSQSRLSVFFLALPCPSAHGMLMLNADAAAAGDGGDVRSTGPIATYLCSAQMNATTSG